MPHVRVKENEPFDIALRRFKRSCEKAGVLSEVRRREFYEKPTAVRKRKAAAAVKRHIKNCSANPASSSAHTRISVPAVEQSLGIVKVFNRCHSWAQPLWGRTCIESPLNWGFFVSAF